MIGASAGAMPNSMLTPLITRCARAPAKQSRTIARPTITPAPADRPCSTRKASSMSIEVASAQPTEASVNTPSDTTITGLRPSASDSPPCHSDITAYATRYSDSVCCNWNGEAPNSLPIAGNAGKKVSIANGPIIDSEAMIAISGPAL
jgi:hypothetical protein